MNTVWLELEKNDFFFCFEYLIGFSPPPALMQNVLVKKNLIKISGFPLEYVLKSHYVYLVLGWKTEKLLGCSLN